MSSFPVICLLRAAELSMQTLLPQTGASPSYPHCCTSCACLPAALVHWCWQWHLFDIRVLWHALPKQSCTQNGRLLQPIKTHVQGWCTGGFSRAYHHHQMDKNPAVCGKDFSPAFSSQAIKSTGLTPWQLTDSCSLPPPLSSPISQSSQSLMARSHGEVYLPL